MEEATKMEQVVLISELTQGKQLAKQLLSHLISSSPTHETKEVLVEKILSSYEKALKLLKWEADGIPIGNKSDSHCSFANGSPKSEVLDQDNKHKDVFKKRKTMANWTEQVKICTETGFEGSPDDGYSWRKYGQKDILGAKFPRGYYRCTYRNVQGCLATKQVQKSDEDPAVLEITYKGRHTCTQASLLNKASQSKRKIGLGENQFHNLQKVQPQQEKTGAKPQEEIFTFGAGLEVKTEDIENKEDIFPSFCFASPSLGSDNEDYNIFADTLMENHLMEDFPSPFISPATSESNLFCLSPCHLGSIVFGQNVQTPESDLTEIISTPTSVTNSPIGDLDLLLDKEDFDSNFPFETQNSLDNFSHSHQVS